jgi:putative transposase
VTKGFPFTGDVADHEDDILGYKDGNQYYQWAVLKIVGLDVPLVLDAIPRKRGQSKDEIVEKLLEHTTEMTNLDLVMMDRECDSAGVKETCEEYGVHYLNPTRIFDCSEEAETIEWMYRNGKRFHVTEEETDDTPTRKQLYLPKRSNSDNDEDDADESLSEAWTEMCGEWDFDEDEMETCEELSFSRLLADIRCEEEVEKRKQQAQDGDVDTAGTVIFEMNHPYVTARDTDGNQMDGKTFIYMIERMIHRYRYRWGIENGFKKQKHFMVQLPRWSGTTLSSTSRSRASSTMYGDSWIYSSKSLSMAKTGRTNRANQFLTVAKQYHGLDPPA